MNNITSLADFKANREPVAVPVPAPTKKKGKCNYAVTIRMGTPFGIRYTHGKSEPVYDRGLFPPPVKK